MTRAPHVFECSQLVLRPMDEVFGFFSDAQNLETITPGFLRFRILSPLPIEMRVGARIDYALSLFGVPVRWRTRITAWEPGVRFVDEQERGPFALWRHTHRFEAVGDGVLIHDRVEYLEPLGALGRLAHGMFVSRLVEGIFEHRRQVIERLLPPGADSDGGDPERPLPTHGEMTPAKAQ